MSEEHTSEAGAPNGGTRHSCVKPTPMTAEGRGRPLGKMLLAIGALMVAGLAITLVVLRAQAPPGEARPPSAEHLSATLQTVRDNKPVGTEEPVAPPPKIREAPAAKPVPRGPSGVVAVPSAGLRSAPSLDAHMTKTVVKERDRVTILQRRASSSGPDWIQVATASGRTGWVWASVVKQKNG